MNPDASEFIPQHKNPVIDQIHNALIGIVFDYFKDTDSGPVSKAASKVVDAKSGNNTNQIDANVPVAKALVALTISRSNGLQIAMPYLKEIVTHLSDESYNSLMSAILNQVYFFVHSEKVKSTLIKMSEGESVNFREECLTSLTNENIETLPIHLPELVNLILELIQFMFEKRRESEDKLMGPSQLCMDLLYLSDSIFRLQIRNSVTQLAKELEANASINGCDNVKIDRATFKANQAKKQGVTEWYEFFCLICEAISKVAPVVNYMLLSANESILSGAWYHSVNLSNRQRVLDSRVNECAFFTIPNLAALFESTLTRLREVLVQPEALNKWHARSSALDTLLLTCSLPSVAIPSHSGGASDLAEHEESGDDYADDYEKFLASMASK
ncbi:hypothetical protein Ciccas_002950 [Cichlidogyrus casuarinus]|uniref:Uncharacterized protein n=1 Tax=Cichlidogyrus casuarinus TaxID=1844966 RepID=A0ABD2QJ16_9PLAT